MVKSYLSILKKGICELVDLIILTQAIVTIVVFIRGRIIIKTSVTFFRLRVYQYFTSLQYLNIPSAGKLDFEKKMYA